MNVRNHCEIVVHAWPFFIRWWLVGCWYKSLFWSKQFVLPMAEIWDALRAAADADLDLAQAIVDSAGIIIPNADMTLCYDERGKYSILPRFFIRTLWWSYLRNSRSQALFIAGAKYELPKYVLSEPTNLIRDSWSKRVKCSSINVDHVNYSRLPTSVGHSLCFC